MAARHSRERRDRFVFVSLAFASNVFRVVTGIGYFSSELPQTGAPAQIFPRKSNAQAGRQAHETLVVKISDTSTW
jgi:hypothetical protein